MGGRSMCAVALLLASGCMNSEWDYDLGDERMPGDRGRSELYFSDGLCPGWGSCDLETRIAVGAAPEVIIQIPGWPDPPRLLVMNLVENYPALLGIGAFRACSMRVTPCINQ